MYIFVSLLSFLQGVRSFVLSKRHVGQLSSMPRRARGTVVTWADRIGERQDEHKICVRAGPAVPPPGGASNHESELSP